MSQPIIEGHDLQVVFGGRKVLDVPYLAVEQGEVLVIVGPNGSGKSTLLQVLALLLPAAGRLTFAGEAVNTRPDKSGLHFRRRMAVVFQEPLLLDTSVRENVATGLKLRGTRGHDLERRISLWLERFGIAHLAARSPRTLSGGEAQRVSLARAFVVEPEVLLLDEPFASLDLPTRYALMGDLKSVLARTSTTVVLVTHDRDEALALADRVGVMLSGRLAQIDRTEAVFRSPASEEVAAFIGVENVLRGKVASQQGGLAWVVVEGRILEAVSELAPDTPVLACVRPEDITLSLRRAGETTSARNRLAGHVARIDDRGSQWRVVVDCGFPLVVLITRQSGHEMGLAPGSEVAVAFKATAAHLIPRA